MITHFLITQSQKEELIKELNFGAENLWLKDFYLSKIRSEVRQSSEHEGMVKRRTYNDTNSSHLCLRSDHDESGTTPPRFAIDNEDMPLRKARENSNQAANMLNTAGPRPKGGADQTPSQGIGGFVEVSVLDVLKQRNNQDVRLIDAEKHFTR